MYNLPFAIQHRCLTTDSPPDSTHPNPTQHQSIYHHASSTWRSCAPPAYRAHRKARNHCARPPIALRIHRCSPTCCSASSPYAAAGTGSYSSGTWSVRSDGFDCCVSLRLGSYLKASRWIYMLHLVHVSPPIPTLTWHEMMVNH
jgi:hypothetical protein